MGGSYNASDRNALIRSYCFIGEAYGVVISLDERIVVLRGNLLHMSLFLT